MFILSIYHATLRTTSMNKSRLKRLSIFMSMMCTILMVVLPILVLSFWLNFESNAQSLAITEYTVLQIDTIKTWQIVCATLYSLLTTIVVVYALAQLKRLFTNFRNDDIFTEASVRSIHRFCLALFVSVLFRILNTAVLSVLLTLNHGPNQKALVISFGSNEFWLLFISATFLAISWSFKEGLSLANENASFV